MSTTMRGPARAIRDAWLVAGFDLAESLRSRKVLVLLVLYVAASVGATMLFTEVLQEIETELAEQLLVARTTQPGSLTQAVMESPEVLRVLSRLVRDDALARRLLALPPIALLYHWVALAFGPAFVVLTSSDSISSEFATGSARFALFRTDRASWAIGKLLGQSALLLLGLACGALAAFITGYVRLASFEPLETALWLMRFLSTAFFFAFAHAGLALGVSQLTRSVPWSRALGLLALAVVFFVPMQLGRESVMAEAPVLTETLRQLFPIAHRLDLWRPEASDVLRSALLLTALGLSYFSLGHLVFARRDA